MAPLGLTHTSADSAAEWSPEHIGEPEEDFPLFTIIRHVIFRPIGLAPAQPLPGDRATFYVPRSDDTPGRGRRLMYMRDLASAPLTLRGFVDTVFACAMCGMTAMMMPLSRPVISDITVAKRMLTPLAAASVPTHLIIRLRLAFYSLMKDIARVL